LADPENAVFIKVCYTKANPTINFETNNSMLPSMSSVQFMNDYLEALLTDAGMENLSPELKAQMLRDLRARLEDRLFGTIVMNLEEPKLTTFRQLVESEAPQGEVEQFLNSQVPNASELFSEAMLKFRSDYLGVA
jgi:hypothetical protein